MAFRFETPLKKKAERIDAVRKGVREVPAEIVTATWLRALCLTDNPLEALPTEIGGCASLRELWLGDTKLRALPESLARLEHLEILSLARTELEELPEWVGALSSLQMLHLGGARFARLAPAVGRLAKLETLSIEPSSRVKSLPDAIGALPALRTLSVCDGALARLPSLRGCRALESVRLYGQPALDWASVTDALADLPSLDTLLLGGGKGKKLAPSVGRLTALTSLYAQDAGLVDLPAELSGCAALQEIDLAGNPLRAAPGVLSELPELRSLVLSRCARIDWDRSGLERLTELTSLTLAECGLDRVPAGLERLTKLRDLHLAGNAIPPAAIRRLRKALPECDVTLK